MGKQKEEHVGKNKQEGQSEEWLVHWRRGGRGPQELSGETGSYRHRLCDCWPMTGFEKAYLGCSHCSATARLLNLGTVDSWDLVIPFYEVMPWAL